MDNFGQIGKYILQLCTSAECGVKIRGKRSKRGKRKRKEEEERRNRGKRKGKKEGK
jgi:hypothetical protein